MLQVECMSCDIMSCLVSLILSLTFGLILNYLDMGSFYELLEPAVSCKSQQLVVHLIIQTGMYVGTCVREGGRGCELTRSD